MQVNPLYDQEKRRSSPSSTLDNTRRNPLTGMDDADGAFISKTRFLQHWRDKPAMILEPYNIDTEENVLHFLARFDTK